MNLREGTRRLALLLGVVGAIFGGFVSYFQLQSTMLQRAEHRHFEQLANSQAAKVERNCILGRVGEQGCREPGNGPYPNTTRVSLPNGEVRDYPKEMSVEQIEAALRKEFPPGNPNDWEDVDPKILKPMLQYMDDNGNPIPAPPTTKVQYYDDQGNPIPAPTTKLQYYDDQGNPLPVKNRVYLDDNGNPIPQSSSPSLTSSYAPDDSTFNKDGIAVISWSKSFAVASIETTDGHTLYPTPAPGAWSYVLIGFLPLLGFFIPWGTVRTVVWVVAGFVQPR